MILPMRRFKYVIIPLGLSLIAGLVYLYTAAPFMLWLDAPDFVAAITTLGINNPPEPLYVFIAHFFTFLPFGSIIFRLQIFSALLASISLFLLYRIILWLVEQINITNIDKKKVSLSKTDKQHNRHNHSNQW